MKTLYLINHSHTDIGYTARQEDIAAYHVDYIRQVLAIIADLEAKGRADEFVWTCENFWQVQNFWHEATPAEQTAFLAGVEAGHIDMSLNYLNMTELVDATALDHSLARGRRFAKQLRRKLDSAMTADVNGFAWAYADKLLNNGIENLFTCIHGHHGLYPLFKNQTAFWWETQDGRRLLVWNGEHYQIGNELGMMPDAPGSYSIKDQFAAAPDSEWREVAHTRINKYFDALAQEGYPYDFAPVMISGMSTDNAGPNEAVVDRIAEWNAQYGSEIQVKMIGVTGFFAMLREQTAVADLPAYRGDWNDWWADGVGSTPGATKIYRAAQRQYQLAERLAPAADATAAAETQAAATEAEAAPTQATATGASATQTPATGATALPDPAALATAESQLMLFAEHTWGYHSSVSEPWATMVNELEYRKANYAVTAGMTVNTYLNKLTAARFGRVWPRVARSKTYKVVNPHDRDVTAPVTLALAYWETLGGKRLSAADVPYIEAYDLATGTVYPRQVTPAASDYEVEVVVSLAPHEEKRLGLRLGDVNHETADYHYVNFVQGAEGVQDIAYPGKPNELTIATDDFLCLLDETRGIKTLIDKATGKNLLREAEAPLFAGIYEVTPVKTDPCQERRRMGRNRKGKGVQRDFARLTDIRNVADGAVFKTIALDYALAGTQLYSVQLKFYKHLPKIEATVRVQKTNEWAPENLYVSLPLAAQGDLYAEKGDRLFRPAIDQLPGTNTDFFLLNSGLLYRQPSGHMLGLCLKDTPLVTLGDLDPHLIQLAGPQTAKKNQAPLYAWVMNNFWETNFKVDLSGFYEFGFDLFTQSRTESLADAHAALVAENLGVVTLITNED
ncbi:glycoside hydrolase family 38 N-terminal domain-containing protein [Lacticaseibacillus suihuaensis]